MDDSASALAAASAVRNRLADVGSSPQPPGTLTKWSDGDNNAYWEFTGNGQTTPTDLVQTTLQREAQDGNTAAQPVAENRAFAEAAASSLLQTSTPNQPIPRGEVKELSLQALVGLIGPFLKNYAAQQKQTQTVGSGTGSGTGTGKPGEKPETDVDTKARIATGQIVSQGLTLPLD